MIISLQNLKWDSHNQGEVTWESHFENGIEVLFQVRGHMRISLKNVIVLHISSERTHENLISIFEVRFLIQVRGYIVITL